MPRRRIKDSKTIEWDAEDFHTDGKLLAQGNLGESVNVDIL